MFKIINEQRFWLIELIINWEGRINSSHLQRYCQIGRQQASKVIKKYQNLYVDQIEYNASKKSFIPTNAFTPQLISKNVDEYLSWMSGKYDYFSSKKTIGYLSITIINVPARVVSPNTIRVLVHALKNKKRVEINYISVSNPNSEGRIIVPVRFVNTGQRWHLRAWCERSQDYRDFVLSRIRGVPTYEGSCLNALPEDMAWNTVITLRLQPDPRLSSAQKAVLMHEYELEQQELKISTRAALAHYLLQEMHVNIKTPYENPVAQQFILINKEEVEDWLFS